jgi:lipoic acid synthetase
VTRDDLEDGGAEHFYRCVLAVREQTSATIEVLTPDFVHNEAAVRRVLEAAPEVFNHNTETVPRLYRRVRGPKSDYRWTLGMLREVKQQRPEMHTKSGIMLGLGETMEEVIGVLKDLHEHQCDFLTIGQYLQPGNKFLPVERYVPPEDFDELGRVARRLGFKKVASAPLVRSSYHARAMAQQPGEELRGMTRDAM